MSAIDHLLRLCAEYRAATDTKVETASWRIFGDSKKLQALLDGQDIQVKRLEKAIRWLADNWPADARWPEDIARPAPGEAAA
jgi:hypothetical protein